MRCHVIVFIKFDLVLSKVVKCFVLVTALPFMCQQILKRLKEFHIIGTICL